MSIRGTWSALTPTSTPISRRQRSSGDFSRQVEVEPNTEAGLVAAQYNLVLGRINAETRKRAVPIIAMSAHVFRTEIDEHLKAGMGAFIAEALDTVESIERAKAEVHHAQ